MTDYQKIKDAKKEQFFVGKRYLFKSEENAEKAFFEEIFQLGWQAKETLIKKQAAEDRDNFGGIDL